MTRRSTRLMRLENSLYNYNSRKESWDVKEIPTKNINTNHLDIFELGSYFTCKHMSQKVNPISFRLSNNKTWDSAWFTKYKYTNLDSGKLQTDLVIREYLQSVFNQFKILIDKIYVKEIDNRYIVKVYMYEQGISNQKDVVLGLKKVGRFKSFLADPENDKMNPFYTKKLKGEKNWFIDPNKVIIHLERQLLKQLGCNVCISLVYKNNIGTSANLLGQYLCNELEKPNTNFKKALRDCLQKIKSKSKIRGLRVNCSGRLGRAPMAKMEWFRYGSIPLTKLSTNIDYTQLTGKTRYGSFGLKIWLCQH
jgi:ribosomal protein S3